jgi:putative hydrolase of the HAD superfamily
MTTVLVHGVTNHPEHQAMAGWTELPAHIHHRTDALPAFLAAIVTSLAGGKTIADGVSLQAQLCLT